MHVSQEKLSVLALKYSKHKIPVDGIEVKFGAKVNSGQIKQSNIESWQIWKSNNQTLADLEIKQSNFES